MDSEKVRTELGLADCYAPWLAELEDVGPPPAGLAPYDPRAVLESAGLLAIPDGDRADIAAAGAAIAASPALAWLVERCRHLLLAGQRLDHVQPAHWPALPAGLGATAACFYVHVFTAALPEIRELHSHLGVPDDLAAATLADLGRHLVIDRAMRGHACLDSQNWLQRHWRGKLFEVGRLQYEPVHHGAGHHTSATFAAADQTTLRDHVGVGTPALNLHIPVNGPLTVVACDESLVRARSVLRNMFPDVEYDIAVCTSWLLDEQLTEYLPPDSNIVRFQQRFTNVTGAEDATDEMHRFIFQRPAPFDLDRLPQRTTLERAFVEHLRRGGRWQMRTGWFDLPD